MRSIVEGALRKGLAKTIAPSTIRCADGPPPRHGED
jgi:hypothetical protein